jgi:RES domain-containing protein
MFLWRLSTKQHAAKFDGGYGLLFDGRWNTIGHAVTDAATSPALCVLEKLVHVDDPTLLPELAMVRYDVPDTIGVEEIALAALPDGWRKNEAWTQRLGDLWHRSGRTALLKVPSAIVPIEPSPDRNVVINNRHPDAAAIRIASIEPFALDTRLL